jgi:general secretion pathway protein A
MSERHREALAHLIYGMGSDGGFVLLTGEIGAGKTTVCRCLLDQVAADTDVAVVLNPALTVSELLATLCDELRISYPEGATSVKGFIDRINTFLLANHARNRKTVLIIDEAQNLAPEVLEQVRLLTNLETDRRKLLQIILLGQPELRDILSRPELRQLSQRITARYHLGPLSGKETADYISHRLSVAGVRRRIFPPSILRRLHGLSGGIPRLINILCDRALLGTYVREQETVTRGILAEAASEVFGHPEHQRRRRYLLIPVFGMALLGTAFLLWGFRQDIPLSWPLAHIEITAPAESVRSEEVTPIPPALIWPAELPPSPGEAEAFQALFALWGVSYDPATAAACDFAPSAGLHCLYQQGNLGNLRRFNRPALLKLYDRKDGEFFATITDLNDQTATLVVGKESFKVPAGELDARWLGEFTLLWRPPAPYLKTVRPGERGPMVEWIDVRMAQLTGRDPRNQKNPELSGDLLREVKDFQRSRGLSSDGFVGPKTLAHLDMVEGDGSPVLVPGEAEAQSVSQGNNAD